MVPAGKGLRRDFCLEKAREALSEYAKSHRPVNPPISIESIAEWMGFQVVLLSSVDEEFSGIVSIPQKLIGVNANHHRHRRRFTIGHELAHILLKHPPESRSSLKEIALYNAEADACAAELLIPASMLIERMKTHWSIEVLATDFDVSEEAMRVKLKTMGQNLQDTH